MSDLVTRKATIMVTVFFDVEYEGHSDDELYNTVSRDVEETLEDYNNDAAWEAASFVLEDIRRVYKLNLEDMSVVDSWEV